MNEFTGLAFEEEKEYEDMVKYFYRDSFYTNNVAAGDNVHGVNP